MTEISGPSGGVKQRDLVKMTPVEIEAFLHDERTATLCTINHDGTIHAVAMWYGFVDGAMAFETKAKGQKVKNLRRDPRITCLVEAGDAYDELRGVELVGTAEIIDDPERMFEVGRSVFERYVGPYSEDKRAGVEAMLSKRVAIRVNVDRVVSWDHRKLRQG